MSRFAFPRLRSVSKVIGVALGLGGAFSAFAAPVVTITGNSGTLRVTNYSPLSITTSNVIDPYGPLPLNPGAPTVTMTGPLPLNPGAPTVTMTGPTVTISLPLDLAAFMASASNSSGGETSQMDGKLDFNVSFSSPIFLQATFSETGNYSTNGIGTVSMLAGTVITETDNLAGITDGGNLTSIFSGNNWSAGLMTDGFTQAYSNYHVSIDNELIAEALADSLPASATISKATLTITLSPGAGGPAPEPATAAFLVLPLAAMAFRRRKNAGA